MHKNTIDWYRQVHITLDAPLAEKRWATAEAIAKDLSRARIIALLRLYLFPPANTDFTQQFTNEIITLDPEFPIKNNKQDLRLMAGLVMVASFEEGSNEADAFGLGLRAANFPAKRVQPIEPEILALGEKYLAEKANRLRPNNFDTDSVELGKELTRRVEQLAEECALLWWVLVEYSDALNRPLNELASEEYAFTAAVEAAKRTVTLPPPPSIGPLLARALQSCKSAEKKLVLSDYIKATNSSWRAAHVKIESVADCVDLTPLSAVLEKVEELGSAASALKAVVKHCPGLKGELSLIPAQASQQFYNELLFLRSLGDIAD